MNDDHFQLADYPLPNGTLIEASAGTGKTYSVAAHVTLAIATDESLRIGNILVTTFTRNAAAELRDRIRGRMVATAHLLRGHTVPGHTPDLLDEAMLADEAARVTKARRLERAVAEFDTALISTIHSISMRVLRLAGVETSDAGDEDCLARVIDEVVNDAVVAEAVADPPVSWNEKPLRELVRAVLGDPFIELFDGGNRTAAETSALDRVGVIVKACVTRVHERMSSSPSFDDLLRRAWDEVRGDKPKTVVFREELRRRFRLGIVDEAQDTSRLQWEFLHEIFPPTDSTRPLIAVGDPKQAIYGFRGADVMAYLRFAQSGGEHADHRRTLTTNYRSDGPLIAGLNRLLADAEFGPGIAYRAVTPALGREVSRLVHLPPVELLDIGEERLDDVAVRKVRELLAVPVYGPGDGRPFRPSEVCVLVRTNAVGARIEQQLAEIGIPAVITGTASVMAGQMALDVRALLEAMERPSSLGRSQRAAATAFFGRSFADVGRLTEGELEAIQDRIAELHTIMQRFGFAAVAAEVTGDEKLATRLANGPGGERRIVDFSHISELLQEAGGGKGCHARTMLERFAELENRDEKGDLVMRRVESDDEAVKIMTVHNAKGLEFPCVVIVDGWKRWTSIRPPAVFYRGDARLLDIGSAVEGVGVSAQSKQAVLAATAEETRRLIYVAVTRPRHHLCILRVDGWRQESLLGEALPGMPTSASDIDPEDREILRVRPAAELPPSLMWKPPRDSNDAGSSVGLAALPERAARTVIRTSFTRITEEAANTTFNPHTSDGGGNDEFLSRDDGAAKDADDSDSQEPVGIAAFTIPDLPSGTAFGTFVHDILERFNPSRTDAGVVASAMRGLVNEMGTSRFLEPYREPITDVLAAAMQTPFGGPAIFADFRFVDFPANERLSELEFDMAVASMSHGVLASDVGRVLGQMLPAGDPLQGYATRLASTAFKVPLAGLINGSIDAVLRLPGWPRDNPRLVIADYKTNRLHDRGDTKPLTAYAHAKLVKAMAKGHYVLQALVYGTAVYRMLRWRLGSMKPADWDPEECIAGVVYGFVRGMKGPETPVDSAGRRYGVFTWQPPKGIWRRLSDLLEGDREGLNR